MQIKGHRNAVVQVGWSLSDEAIYSASADKTLGVWDSQTGKRLRRLSEHEAAVNALAIGRQNPHLLASVGNDNVCYTWDTRERSSSIMIQQQCPLTAVALLDERNNLFTGGLDNLIYMWDLRKTTSPTNTFSGHMDTPISFSIDNDGNFLLSNSFDFSIRHWDIRPYATGDRCTKVFYGATHGIDKSLIRCGWSPEGDYIGSGSADCQVYIWDTLTQTVKSCLPGHRGVVTEVAFHPTEPIIASSSIDKTIFVGGLSVSP